jgi:hypothetical protein
VYKILAVVGLIGGSVLLAGYATHPQDGNARLAVAGVVLAIVGVLSAWIARDAAKTRSTR